MEPQRFDNVCGRQIKVNVGCFNLYYVYSYFLGKWCGYVLARSLLILAALDRGGGGVFLTQVRVKKWGRVI